MKKLTLFMHVSLDGYVAGPNGEMDWIKLDDTLFDYVENMAYKADTALYGRKTWEMMESYWPTAAQQPNATKHDINHARWYNAVKKIVMSKTLKGASIPNTTVVSDNAAAEVEKLKHQSGGIMVFGSPSASHFLMANNLADEFLLMVNPIVLGQGIPFFAKMDNKINLKLESQERFPGDVMAMQYSVVR